MSILRQEIHYFAPLMPTPYIYLLVIRNVHKPQFIVVPKCVTVEWKVLWLELHLLLTLNSLHVLLAKSLVQSLHHTLSLESQNSSLGELNATRF